MRVLYVDDDPDLRDLALIGLAADPGIEARAAASGAEALALLGDWAADLVMVDLRMPGMDGAAFVRRLRAGAVAGAAPRVVIASAFTSLQDAAHLGADAVLAKPFDPTALPRLARSWLG